MQLTTSLKFWASFSRHLELFQVLLCAEHLISTGDHTSPFYQLFHLQWASDQLFAHHIAKLWSLKNSAFFFLRAGEDLYQECHTFPFQPIFPFPSGNVMFILQGPVQMSFPNHLNRINTSVYCIPKLSCSHYSWRTNLYSKSLYADNKVHGDRKYHLFICVQKRTWNRVLFNKFLLNNFTVTQNLYKQFYFM